ncbi:cytosine deaminase [Polymorphum gilvum]|uniref:Amidohydrolase family, putative n=1 Tax=Polymorphum gilvum (strain LMG 25793 / CGMCC 1.9160 / SL003B-26A1) TaxID=991905 RepID=F2IWC5_POLGS|nr:cytosine deaminase [Polymorphum gilvum]ADZ69224.1 Amidohydrolase family, putative [Polymorphum gilvum SL003B-26A1]
MGAVLTRPLAGEGVLANASVPSCLLPAPLGGGAAAALIAVDLEICGGRLRRIAPAGTLAGDGPAVFDLDAGMVLPTLVDMHTHLDKGHIAPRKANPDGTFMGALAAVGEDRAANWTAADVRRRMEFGLRCAHAHGTSLIRTHIDSLPPQDEISWPVFKEIRAEWRGRIELQGSCLFGIDRLDLDGDFLARIADRVREAGGILGAVTYMIPGIDAHLDAVFQAAMARGLDLDFHVDETADPAAVTLRRIAEAAIRNRFEGRIVCGHCCSLANQGAEEADRTLDLVAEAGIGVVSLPMCNMYLQDRVAGRTPRWRGVTLLHEMKARGIPVAVASDNTRDPFYAYGDLDLIEVYAQATRILHFDHPIADWIRTVTTAPAAMLRQPGHGRLAEGAPADLILFRTRTWSETLSRPHGPREVLRAGCAIDRILPDYRELDDIMVLASSAAQGAAQ